MTEFEDHPLLHDADLMHTLLKVAREAPAGLDDAAAWLRADLRLAREDPPVTAEQIMARLLRARRYLCRARLLETLDDGRVRATERGRQVLRDHPDGVDGSVLMAFPEFREFIREAAGRPPEEARATVYDDGYAAYGRGAGPADNPYPFDTAAHLAWENGWFEARDEDDTGWPHGRR